MNEVSAKQRFKPTTSNKTKQHLLSNEVFSPRLTKFERKRFIPQYKDETRPAVFIDKSSLSKSNNNNNNNYNNNKNKNNINNNKNNNDNKNNNNKNKFILTVTDLFYNYAWALPLKNNSCLFITNRKVMG